MRARLFYWDKRQIHLTLVSVVGDWFLIFWVFNPYVCVVFVVVAVVVVVIVVVAVAVVVVVVVVVVVIVAVVVAAVVVVVVIHSLSTPAISLFTSQLSRGLPLPLLQSTSSAYTLFSPPSIPFHPSTSSSSAPLSTNHIPYAMALNEINNTYTYSLSPLTRWIIYTYEGSSRGLYRYVTRHRGTNRICTGCQV